MQLAGGRFEISLEPSDSFVERALLASDVALGQLRLQRPQLIGQRLTRALVDRPPS
jgi:hypothetical protein